MLIRSRGRVVLALAFALLTVGATAAPAAAETIIQDCGAGETCAYWEVYDGGPPYGATCKYETGSYDLDSMTAAAPLMHGPYSTKTKVGWQFKVWRSTNFGGTWRLYARGPWDYAMANDAIPARAGYGFNKMKWYAPESPTGWFKMRLYLRWFSAGGSLIGNVVVELDNYKRVWNGNTGYTTDYCLLDW